MSVCGVIYNNSVVVYSKLKQKTTDKVTTNTDCYELSKCLWSRGNTGSY